MIFRAMHHRRAPDALRDTIVYRRDVTARGTGGALIGLLQLLQYAESWRDGFLHTERLLRGIGPPLRFETR